MQKCARGEEVKRLSDVELLALILGTGIRNLNVMELSAKLLKRFGSIYGLAQAGIKEISALNGIGTAKAIRIHSAIEIGRRSLLNVKEVEVIDTPEAVWRVMLPEMGGLQKEEFRSLCLNNKNHLIRKSVISVGTVNQSIVHPREVFRDAIREGASGIIVVHNHPSGSLTPSSEDIETTKRISEAGRILGIPLLDHVIVTNTSYVSLRETGSVP